MLKLGRQLKRARKVGDSKVQPLGKCGWSYEVNVVDIGTSARITSTTALPQWVKWQNKAMIGNNTVMEAGLY
jgi:hypothetical protein